MARPWERKFLGFSFTNDRSRTAHRPEGPRTVQGAGPGTDEADSGCQFAAVDRGTAPVPDRLARLLRLLPDAVVLHNLDAWIRRRLRCILAAVEEGREPLCGTAPTGCVPVPRGGSLPAGVMGLADGRHAGRAAGLAQRATSTRSASPTREASATLNPIEPPWYGPVCPVVWEGRSREAPPYPDVCRACSTAWGCKSPTQPDGGEVRAKRKGVAARRGLKEAWSETAT